MDQYFDPGLVCRIREVTRWDRFRNLITISEQKFAVVRDVYVACAGVFEIARCPRWTIDQQPMTLQA